MSPTLNKNEARGEIIDDEILTAFNKQKEIEQNNLLGVCPSDDSSMSGSNCDSEENETVAELPMGKPSFARAPPSQNSSLNSSPLKKANTTKIAAGPPLRGSTLKKLYITPGSSSKMGGFK